jgi:hypothetical protein
MTTNATTGIAFSGIEAYDLQTRRDQILKNNYCHLVFKCISVQHLRSSIICFHLVLFNLLHALHNMLLYVQFRS